jgi:hypothetical protein
MTHNIDVAEKKKNKNNNYTDTYCRHFGHSKFIHAIGPVLFEGRSQQMMMRRVMMKSSRGGTVGEGVIGAVVDDDDMICVPLRCLVVSSFVMMMMMMMMMRLKNCTHDKERIQFGGGRLRPLFVHADR